ncbi:MAG TPA: hypothetical protein VGQ87_01840 [Patescibacteria group bacterium]|jgi:hypothetical protein|nr:hypothetical protein [Patescibacteria group bacterium]
MPRIAYKSKTGVSAGFEPTLVVEKDLLHRSIQYEMFRLVFGLKFENTYLPIMNQPAFLRILLRQFGYRGGLPHFHPAIELSNSIRQVKHITSFS